MVNRELGMEAYKFAGFIRAVLLNIDWIGRMDESETRRKINYFKKSIRRQQINQFFTEQRQLLLQNHDEPLALELKSNWEKQKEYLDKYSLAMTGEPNRQWLQIISSLSKITLYFDGEFEYWFTCSIVKSLCDAIRQANPQLRLVPAICELFSDMMCLSSQKGTMFVQRLVEYQITLDVIKAGIDQHFSVCDRLKIMNFCSHLCSYDIRYHKQVIRNGGAMLLVLLGQSILKDYFQNVEICEKYLSYSFIILKESPFKIGLNNYNLFCKMIPIVVAFLYSPSSNKVLALGFRLLAAILNCNKEFIYSTVYKFNGLLRKIVTTLAYPDMDVRFFALQTLCNLLFTENVEVPLDLVDLGLINQLYAAWKLPNSPQQHYYMRLMLNTLGNLADSYKEFSNSIVDHPIFEILIDQIQSCQLKNKDQAFYCLNTLICNLNYNSLQKIIVQYDLLHYLMLGLNEMRDVSPQTTVQILSALKAIVDLSQKIFSIKDNSVVNQLQGKYRITSVLQQILQKSKSQPTCIVANEIHSLIAGNLWNSHGVL